MASNRLEVQKEMHFKVLQLLSKNPELSTRQIANKINVSNGSAYYCVHALIEKGLIKFERFFKSNNKQSYAYNLTKNGLKEKSQLTLTFLEKKHIEYELLKQELKLLQEEIDSEYGS